MSCSVCEVCGLNLKCVAKLTSGKDEAEAKTPIGPKNPCKKEMQCKRPGFIFVSTADVKHQIFLFHQFKAEARRQLA